MPDAAAMMRVGSVTHPTCADTTACRATVQPLTDCLPACYSLPPAPAHTQIHPRPRQEAAAQAAAAAEAALMMQQITSQAQAMGMDPQTYMQQGETHQTLDLM